MALRTFRCLVVDDSPTFRAVLRRVFARAPGLQIVGEAGDGEEAVVRTLELRPDVITMDVRMPRRDGLQAIAEIMRVRPTPIVVISAAAGDGNDELTFQALKLGALEVLGKPNALAAPAFEAQTKALRDAVYEVASLAHRPRPAPRATAAEPAPRRRGPLPKISATSPLSCIGVVASTGGPPALARVLSALPGDFPAPIVVVQHIARGFLAGMVRWLAPQCAVQVRLAARGDALAPATVLFAPDDFHTMISLGRVRLDDGPPVKSLRPSGTVLLSSLAREYGAAAAGLVLTGMGDDGVAGLQLMRDRGSFTAAQGKASSVVFGMPEVALRTGAAQVALEVEEIAPALVRLVSGAPATAPAGRRPKLLLVDDSETILALEQALFSDAYELVVARDGAAALEAARTHLPDAILLDHTMPKLTGAQVLEQLRAAPETQALRVVMVSSETAPEIVGAWRRFGAQAVHGKPIDRAALVATVRKLTAS